MAKTYYGIDFGTTYSSIAKTLSDQTTLAIQDGRHGNRSNMPSLVCFKQDEEGASPYVGEIVKAYMNNDSDSVVKEIKREIGSGRERPREFYGKRYYVADIVSIILKKIKEYAQEANEVVTDIIMTCPANFGYNERGILRDAAKKAELNPIDMINEPTAAVLYHYGNTFSKSGNILIYDLGGGTFDVTLAKIEDNPKIGVDIQIIFSNGRPHLGGTDWDNEIYQLLLECYARDENSNIKDLRVNEPELIVRFRNQAQGIKEALTEVPEIDFFDSGSRGGPWTTTVTRKQFEQATQHLVQETLSVLESVLKANNLSSDQITAVLLVGGSSFMPMIQKAVRGMFPRENQVLLRNPLNAVAEGAAKSALINFTDAVIDRNGKPVSFRDILPRSIGIGLRKPDDPYRGKFMILNLLFKNDSTRDELTYSYKIERDDQKEISIPIYQNINTDKNNPWLLPPIDPTGREREVASESQIENCGNLCIKVPPGANRGYEIDLKFLADTQDFIVEAYDHLSESKLGEFSTSDK